MIQLEYLTVRCAECYEPPRAGPSPTSPASTCGPSKNPPANLDTTPGSATKLGDTRAATPAGTASRTASPASVSRPSPSLPTADTSISSSRTSTTTARSTTRAGVYGTPRGGKDGMHASRGMLEVLYIYLVQREECSIRRRNQEMKRNLDPIHTARELVILVGGGGSHGHVEVLTHPHSVDT
ncbi:hypothetical protein NW767_15814 [Fusarium falciforme]|nr:hypothetical protein NW767_15814 [Fusarium falciforme]